MAKLAAVVTTSAVALCVSIVMAATPQQRAIFVAEVQDQAISPVTAEFIIGSLAAAEADGAALFLLKLDTPGGLDLAMRDIIQAFLASEIPTAVYVAPSGARAASAGFMIALAADVVIMASSTNTGAATPVSVAGGEMDETMHAKIIQDAVAYARSIAEHRGRPVQPAIEAVSSGRSFAASEAVELGLADAIVDDLDDFVARFTGRVVRGDGDQPLVLELEGADFVTVEMSLRQRVLSMLANPQIAYFLLLLGIGGIYFELSNPGAVLPGVVGAVGIILALLAFQQLPFSYAGLALLALAVVFIILEVNVVSYGLLTVAGLVCFLLGSMLLFRGPIPEMRLSWPFVLPVAVTFVAFMALMLQMIVRVHRSQVLTGRAGLISETGTAMTALVPGASGKVFLHGELWQAQADVPVESGQTVEVIEIGSGLSVKVRPLTSERRS